MKRILFVALFACISVLCALAQGMSDTQVMEFVQREAKAGTSQSQIVTKLMQRGVKIDQIRRIRNQYDKQISSRGAAAAADGAVKVAAERMRANGDGTTSQEVTTAKRGTTGEIYTDASEDAANVEHEVQATSGVNEGMGKRVFGRDIFNNRRLTFEPNMNLATPQNYVLGPGDQLVIDIYGASQKTLTITVSPEGTVTVPGYGPIQVSGLSVASAQSKIRSSLGSRYASSNIKLSLGQIRSIMVNVMGEVQVPGTYTMSGLSTVFHALYMAGGISSLGTLRNIKVFRGGKLITVVDIYEYILNGRLAGNVRLQDNDVIQVGPYDCLVGITGNVKRPMFYEMRKNESVSTLLRYAGGFTGDAYNKSVRLTRQTGERYAVFNVDEFDMSSFKIADGDNIEVDGMLNRYENMVEVRGAVFRPGQYQLGRDINSVKTLIERAEGVTEDAYTARAVLHRLKADRSLEVIPVDIAGILNGTVADVPLNNEDVLFIPTQTELRSERTLTITGEVMSPGTYEYADNTTVEDLIIQAGGLTDQASTARVDISRRIVDPWSTTKTRDIAQSFTVSLKNGLVISEEKGFLLQPYDVVHVRRSPGFHTPRNISVTGEVNFEGAFTLQNKNQRLSDAIKAAGGLTSDAYVRGASLLRQMNDEERARAQTVIEAMNNSRDEKDSLSYQMLNIRNTYPIGIDLEKALAHPGSDADIVLREGDHIVVPEYNNTVKISGIVMFPNTVTFESGKGYKYYVNKAGGFGNRAKKSKTFVVYQNGTVAQVGHGAKIEPGCEIIVPSKKKRNTLNLGSWLTIGTSLTSIAAMVATIANMTK